MTAAALELRDPPHTPRYSNAGRHRRGRHARPQPAVEALAVAAMVAVTLLHPPVRGLVRGTQILGVALLGIVLTFTYLAIGERA